MNMSSRVDWAAAWKGRPNKKIVWAASCSPIAANEAVYTQGAESTHQRSCRQRMVSIKRNTTKLLVSLERIFLNYHKHPQNSLQWISGFGASSNYSSVNPGTVLALKSCSVRTMGTVPTLVWLPKLWWSWRPYCPCEKGRKLPLSPFFLSNPSEFLQLGLFTQRPRKTMVFILNSLQTRRPWLF